jgi:hypothetical protein
MSSEDVITAYQVAVPNKQQQTLPGLDKDMNRTVFRCLHISVLTGGHSAGLEYSKQEIWDDEGKPHLVEYAGAGK